VKNLHRGIDVGVGTGTPILAALDGIVTFAGDSGAYGNLVIIAHKNGLETKYAHCHALLVSSGQIVEKGDVIATVGNTGNSAGSHLHFEILRYGQYLNPLFYSNTGDFNSSPTYGDAGSPMGDGTYEALLAEAMSHLGKPYVFGASGPSSFDCSGYVSYVLNQAGIKNFRRTNVRGLYAMTTPIAPGNAQPGDLVFFHSTYSTPSPVSHVGIYLGNGQMIHAGKPVNITSINTTYWQNHFFGFGRLN
jgi:murein DD-endopeptidase MepM/ murein hydrolase activator NlpD